MTLLNFIYSMMVLLLCKYELFMQTRSQCRVPDTQETVKACWTLVKKSFSLFPCIDQPN